MGLLVPRVLRETWDLQEVLVRMVTMVLQEIKGPKDRLVLLGHLVIGGLQGRQDLKDLLDQPGLKTNRKSRQ